MKKCIVAGVLIFSEDGRKVLLVKHRKLGIWIYPGGHIEKSENPLECAIRESKEETGASFEILSTSDFTGHTRNRDNVLNFQFGSIWFNPGFLELT